MAEKDIVSRFGHLLKPIRDLAKNWDVDVASELEEYLLELEEITIAFEGGKANLNFAEAALVIQGSACVYSRKVEYLHALVYQTLDLIVNKKRTEVEEQEREQDVTKSNEDQFPSLDDILEAKNIDMIEKPFMSDINASIIQRTPMSLLPLHNSEKLLDVPLFNNKGELVGSRSDFKLNTSYISDNGALLLEPIKFATFHENYDLSSDSLHLLHNWVEPGGVASDDFVMDQSFHDNTIMDAPPTDTLNKDVSPPISRRRKSSDKSQKKGKQFGKLKLLDPHKPSKKDRPFKKGSTAMLSQDKASSRKRKDSDSLPSPSQPLSEFLFQSIYSNSSQFPSSPLERPSTAEFEEQYWSETKRRKSARKKIEDKVRGTLASQEEEEDHSEDERDNDDISALAALPVETADQPIPELPDHDINEVVDPLDDSIPEPTVVDPAHLPPVIKSYEDLLRSHINHISSVVASHASDTELSKRVNEWEEKIKPRLNEIERHRVFDICYYSNRILSSLQDSSRDHDGAEGTVLVPFERIIEEKSQSDICRTFSALLHLANDGKIEISNHENDDGIVDLDNVDLRLLSESPSS